MNLIATSNFRNPSPDNIVVTGALSRHHIHKGARFSIGGSKSIEELTPEERNIVTLLNRAERIVEASQTELVSRIDAEVEA